MKHTGLASLTEERKHKRGSDGVDDRERNRPAFVCVLYFILVSQQSSARGCWPVVMFYLGSQQFREELLAGICFIYFI